MKRALRETQPQVVRRGRARMGRAALLLGGAALLTASLAACSPVTALNSVVSTGGLSVTADVRYGPDVRNVMDVYAPQQARNAPVVLFIHGGSWTSGDKSEYKFVGESLARAGYVTAVMSYRLAPVNRYPSYVQDAAQAISVLHRDAGRYGGDPSRIFVTGHSAGAFNAMEVVMNARWLKEVGVPVSVIRGVIGVAGPYAYDYRQFPSQNAFPEGSSPDDVMPDRHVRPDAPPTLLLVAQNDTTVDPENGIRMLAALKRAGVKSELRVLPGVNHATIIGGLARPLNFLGGTRDAVLQFLKAHQ